jgi:hypothetical protein
MSTTTVISRGWIPQTADRMVVGKDDLHLEPILGDGPHNGLIVQSSLERVAVFTHNHARLSLSDIGGLRRMKTRAQARRALLLVPQDLIVESAVALLATLSKIEIIRINVKKAGRCLSR